MIVFNNVNCHIVIKGDIQLVNSTTHVLIEQVTTTVVLHVTQVVNVPKQVLNVVFKVNVVQHVVEGYVHIKIIVD